MFQLHDFELGLLDDCGLVSGCLLVAAALLLLVVMWLWATLLDLALLLLLVMLLCIYFHRWFLARAAQAMKLLSKRGSKLRSEPARVSLGQIRLFLPMLLQRAWRLHRLLREVRFEDLKRWLIALLRCPIRYLVCNTAKLLGLKTLPKVCGHIVLVSRILR